jgi:hypothetical protein
LIATAWVLATNVTTEATSSVLSKRLRGKEPALELDTGLCGAFADLEFVQRGFGDVDKDFVLDDRGVDDEVGEEIGILGGQGAELVEERLLGLQFLAERNAWVVVHDSLQAAAPSMVPERQSRAAVLRTHTPHPAIERNVSEV